MTKSKHRSVLGLDYPISIFFFFHPVWSCPISALICNWLHDAEVAVKIFVLLSIFEPMNLWLKSREGVFFYSSILKLRPCVSIRSRCTWIVMGISLLSLPICQQAKGCVLAESQSRRKSKIKSPAPASKRWVKPVKL